MVGRQPHVLMIHIREQRGQHQACDDDVEHYAILRMMKIAGATARRGRSRIKSGRYPLQGVSERSAIII